MRIQSDISYGLAAKVWWFLTWRFIVFAFLGAFAVGFVLGVVMAILNAATHGPALSPLVTGGVGFITGALINIWVVKRVLSKKNRIGGYRLALVKEDEESVR